MNVKNGSKELKKYPQISRRVRDTLARLLEYGMYGASLGAQQQRVTATHHATHALATRSAAAATSTHWRSPTPRKPPSSSNRCRPACLSGCSELAPRAGSLLEPAGAMTAPERVHPTADDLDAQALLFAEQVGF